MEIKQGKFVKKIIKKVLFYICLVKFYILYKEKVRKFLVKIYNIK